MSEEKILKSEELNDEQLDEVAGGSMTQTREDFDFFNSLMPEKFEGHPNTRFLKFQIYLIQKMPDVWKEFGVNVQLGAGDSANGFVDNKYFIGGAEVTSDEAKIHVLRQLKHRQ